MGRKTRFRTIREFVDSHPRTISQNQIARKLGVAPPTLSQWLSGTFKPGLQTAIRLKKEYGIEVDGWLDESRAS